MTIKWDGPIFKKKSYLAFNLLQLNGKYDFF